MALIYYSKMNATPNANILRELQVIKDYFGEKNVLFHNSGKYDETKLQKANAVIVTGFGKGYVGKGVFSEISNALKADIPVFQFRNEETDRYFHHIVKVTTWNTGDVYRTYGITIAEKEDSGEGDDDEDKKIITFSLSQIETMARKAAAGKKDEDSQERDDINVTY